MAVISLIALIHSSVCIAGYFVSASKFTQLTALNYVDVNYFNTYKLNGWHVLLCLVMNLSVFGLLMLLIFKTKEKASDRHDDSS